MHISPLTRVHQSRLALHGLLIFGVGLLAGVFYTFSLLGFIEIWPVLPRIEATVPGDDRAWMRAHSGTLMNAIALLALAGIGSLIHLGDKGQRWLVLSALVMGWGNTLGYHTAALFGHRGLSFGEVWANNLTYACFFIAVVGVFTALGLALRGVLNGRRA